jgi:hypothetical protein
LLHQLRSDRDGIPSKNALYIGEVSVQVLGTPLKVGAPLSQQLGSLLERWNWLWMRRQGVVVVVDQEEVVLVVLEEALALGDQRSGPGGLPAGWPGLPPAAPPGWCCRWLLLVKAGDGLSDWWWFGLPTSL